MQEVDANAMPQSTSPLQSRKKDSPATGPSPNQLHKQYWDGVSKRTAAAKPPKSPLPPSGGSKILPGGLSPRRGVSPLSVKVPAKSPLQGVAANLVKGAHSNPLFADGQHTPKAAGWKSITRAEHSSKENSAPAGSSPRPISKPASEPSLKPSTNSSAVPSTSPNPTQVTTVPVTFTPNPITSPPKADTVIEISANQEVKDRVNFAQNTPPNTPDAQDTSEAAPLTNPVKDNPVYSPSNNPFSPRPEFRRSSLPRGATPGRLPLAAQPDWTSLLATAVPKADPPSPKTPPLTSVSLGGSPRFIEVLLQQPCSERATPRRRLRLSPDEDADVITDQDDDVTSGRADVSGPHPLKSRVRLMLKLLLATVVLMSLGVLEMDPGWVPQELRGAALIGAWAPRGLWQGTPGAERYTGDSWFSNTLFVSDVDWPSSLKQLKVWHPTQEGTSDPMTGDSSLEDVSAVDASPEQLPILRLSFDEYDGPTNLDEIVLGEEPAFSHPFLTEPDPDAGEPDETPDADIIGAAAAYGRVQDPDRLPHEPDVTVTAGLDSHAALLDGGPITLDPSSGEVLTFDTGINDSDSGVDSPEAGEAFSEGETTFPDGNAVLPHVGSAAAAAAASADGGSSAYARQRREAALLEMADLAVRSYTSAFLVALGLFAVFSLAAFAGTHFFPAGTDVRGADDDDVSEGAAGEGDVSEGEGEVAPSAEVTTPMFLRQGVRMEDSVVVTPVNAGGGSPFGRYQAFVRQMIGQNTDSPQLVLTPVQRSRRLADKFRSVAGPGSPSHRFTISPA